MTIPTNNGRERNRKKAGRASGAGSVKILVTAASVAAVVGGWAVFTAGTSVAGTDASADSSADSGAEVTQVVSGLPELPPMPTLVPAPANLGVLPGNSLQPVAGLPGVFAPVPSQSPFATPVAPKLASVQNNSGVKDSTKGSKPNAGGGQRTKPDPAAKSRSSK